MSRSLASLAALRLFASYMVDPAIDTINTLFSRYCRPIPVRLQSLTHVNRTCDETHGSLHPNTLTRERERLELFLFQRLRSNPQ